MANNKVEKWEIKYEQYKGKTKEEISEIIVNKTSENRRQLASIKDTTSNEYKSATKELSENLKDGKIADKIYKNLPLVEKTKENRDVKQELLDELLEAKTKNNDILKERTKLGEEAKKLEEELIELKEMEGYCRNALKNPKATPEQKSHAAKVLQENLQKQTENHDAFSKNKKNMEKQLGLSLVEVPDKDIEELTADIKRENQICTLLMEGKDMREIQLSLKTMKNKDVQKSSKQGQSTNSKLTNTEPVNEEPVNEEPVNEEPVNEEPVNEEPVNEEPVNEEPVNEEPVNEEPVNEEPVNEEPQNEGTASVESTNAQPTRKGKLIKVKVNGKNYEFIYEENGEISSESKEKIGFFKGLKERFNLLRQGKFGYYRTAFKVDPTITQNISEDQMKDYIAFLEQREEAPAPFIVKYEKTKGLMAKAFVKSAEKLGLPEPDEKKSKNLDEKFGEGFDQHDNPPVVQTEERDIDPAKESPFKNIDENNPFLDF